MLFGGNWYRSAAAVASSASASDGTSDASDASGATAPPPVFLMGLGLADQRYS